ncbi:ComG operon protein [Bacillus amyloliquefaciens]|nr:ComG operon protein [Bacillus amyloliquefaciens]
MSMQNGNKGFSTIETLSAMAIWLFLMISLVPVWTGMLTDNLKIEERQEVYQLLHKHISAYMMSGKKQPSPGVLWKEDGDYYKVCAAVRGEKEMCLSILKTDWLYAS